MYRLITFINSTNDTSNNAQKCNYLQASLQSGTAKVFESLDSIASNYDITWQTLFERYNNNRPLVYNHVKALFTMEPVGKE